VLRIPRQPARRSSRPVMVGRWFWVPRRVCRLSPRSGSPPLHAVPTWSTRCASPCRSRIRHRPARLLRECLGRARDESAPARFRA
jgi:hypothetical protein